MGHSSTVELCHCATCVENETMNVEIMFIAAMTVFKKPEESERERKDGTKGYMDRRCTS